MVGVIGALAENKEGDLSLSSSEGSEEVLCTQTHPLHPCVHSGW